jgi:hypothetical protein
MKSRIPKIILAILPLALVCSCASTGTDRRVIATKHTTLHQQTIVAEYPVAVPDRTQKGN